MESSRRIDPSTGLFPQPMMESFLAHEANRSRRYAGPVSLLRISVHYSRKPSAQAVEHAQSRIAGLLNTKLREADLPGVHNGDFMVILPATDGDEARVAAERIIGALSGAQILCDGDPIDIALCIGIASHPGGEGISMAGMLAAAARMLAQAQRSGPGNLAAADESGAPSG